MEDKGIINEPDIVFERVYPNDFHQMAKQAKRKVFIKKTLF